MRPIVLVLRNIRGHSIRSLIIFLCVLAVAGFFISTTLIIRGADNSLHAGLKRLGADIVVVPTGAESKVETALLMGKPTDVWMSTGYLQKVANVKGVNSVSPQIYLRSLYGASCCSVSETFLVAFDPKTDFTIGPWQGKKLGRELAKGEVIGGDYISVPPGEKDIKLYGYSVTLKGNLEPTGTGLDQTIFMTMETAQDIARASLTTAERPLAIPADQISAIMVKVEPAADVHKVALQIMWDVPGVFPIESPQLFGTFRHQMLGLLWVFLALLSLAWVLSIVLIGLVFSMAANERRREMAILRALGATRMFIFRTVVTEAALLAAVAGALGIALSSLLVYMFKDYIADSLQMPFLFPSVGSLLVLFLIGILLSLVTVMLATFLPAYRISNEEPAVAMRE